MSQDNTEKEVEERDRDIDVARMQTKEAHEALDDGEYIDAIEAASSIIGFAARAANRDDPVATVTVKRAGNADDDEIVITPGERQSLEVHGKVEIEVEGYRRYAKDGQ